jgi:hypothetical protein
MPHTRRAKRLLIIRYEARVLSGHLYQVESQGLSGHRHLVSEHHGLYILLIGGSMLATAPDWRQTCWQQRLIGGKHVGNSA